MERKNTGQDKLEVIHKNKLDLKVHKIEIFLASILKFVLFLY